MVYMLGYGVAPMCALPRLWGTTVWINPDGVEWARAKWNRLAKFYFRCMEWFSVRAASRVIADAAAIAAHLERRHGPLRACSVIRYGCEVVNILPSGAAARVESGAARLLSGCLPVGARESRAGNSERFSQVAFDEAACDCRGS